MVETLDERDAVPRHEMWLPEPKPAGAEEGAEDAEDAEPDPDAWESGPPESKLADVLLYLRERHLYCLYCGCQVSWQGGT